MVVVVGSLSGCISPGGETADTTEVSFLVEVAPRERIEHQYVLHVGEADVEALGLPESDIRDHYGDFTLATDREVNVMTSYEYCLEEAAPITREGEEVAVVPAGTCMKGGAILEEYEVSIPPSEGGG